MTIKKWMDRSNSTHEGTDMKHKAFKQSTAAVLTGLLAMTLGACSPPQQPQGSGETEAEVPSSVNLVVPYSPGGGTDTWARFLAPYLEKHVKGSPNVNVENVPGGESITGSNRFVNTGGTDGESLLVTSGTTYFQALLGRPEVKFDFSKMIPLALNGTGGVVYTSSRTGIKSAEELVNYDKKLVFGGISATGLDLSTLLAMDVLGVDIEATFGFEGRGPARLALQRGETNLDYQTTSAYQTQVQPLVDEGKAVPLFSFGVLKDGEVVRDPALPNIPTLEEVYEKINGEKPQGKAYEAYRAFLVPGFVYQKGIWANEGTPDEIVKAFRSASKDIAQDPEFKKKSKGVLGGYPLVSGEKAQEDLIEAFEMSSDVRQYTLDLLKNEYDTTVEGS